VEGEGFAELIVGSPLSLDDIRRESFGRSGARTRARRRLDLKPGQFYPLILPPSNFLEIGRQIEI
jgi:hypothetical protein